MCVCVGGGGGGRGREGERGVVGGGKVPQEAQCWLRCPSLFYHGLVGVRGRASKYHKNEMLLFFKFNKVRLMSQSLRAENLQYQRVEPRLVGSKRPVELGGNVVELI